MPVPRHRRISISFYKPIKHDFFNSLPLKIIMISHSYKKTKFENSLIKTKYSLNLYRTLKELIPIANIEYNRTDSYGNIIFTSYFNVPI